MKHLVNDRELSSVSLNLATSMWDVVYKDGGREAVHVGTLEVQRRTADRFDYQRGEVWEDGRVLFRFDPDTWTPISLAPQQ